MAYTTNEYLERSDNAFREIEAEVRQEVEDAKNICDFNENDKIPVDGIKLDTTAFK